MQFQKSLLIVGLSFLAMNIVVAASREGQVAHETPIGRVTTDAEVHKWAKELEKQGVDKTLIAAIRGDFKEGSPERTRFDAALDKLNKARESRNPREEEKAERAYHEELHTVLDRVHFTAKAGGQDVSSDGKSLPENSQVVDFLRKQPKVLTSLELGGSAVQPRIEFDRRLVSMFPAGTATGELEGMRDYYRELQKDNRDSASKENDGDIRDTLLHVAGSMKNLRDNKVVQGQREGEDKATAQHLTDAEAKEAEAVLRQANANEVASGARGKAQRNSFDSMLDLLLTSDKLERSDALKGVKFINEEYAKQMTLDVKAFAEGKKEVDGVTGKDADGMKAAMKRVDASNPKDTAELIRRAREEMEREGVSPEAIKKVLTALRESAGAKMAEIILARAKELGNNEFAEEFLCARKDGQRPCMDRDMIPNKAIEAALKAVPLPGFDLSKCEAARAKAYDPNAARGRGGINPRNARLLAPGNAHSGENQN